MFSGLDDKGRENVQKHSVGGEALDPSSTVRKIRLLALNDLRNDKSFLALHFPPGRYHWSSRKVGGTATPVACTACEACAVS